MKHKIFGLALILISALCLSLDAAVEKIFEGHTQCTNNAVYSPDKSDIFQEYTREIKILTYESDGKTCYVPVGYKAEYKGNIDFFTSLFDAIVSRADQIISTAPKSTKTETRLHIVVASTGSKNVTLSDSEAAGLLTGGKIIGDAFDIVDGTGNVLLLQCYLIAIKDETITQEQVEEAINQMFTASIGMVL